MSQHCLISIILLALGLVLAALSLVSLEHCSVSAQPCCEPWLVWNTHLDFWVHFPHTLPALYPVVPSHSGFKRCNSLKLLSCLFGSAELLCFTWFSTPCVNHEIVVRQSSKVIRGLKGSFALRDCILVLPIVHCLEVIASYILSSCLWKNTWSCLG